MTWAIQISHGNFLFNCCGFLLIKITTYWREGNLQTSETQLMSICVDKLLQAWYLHISEYSASGPGGHDQSDRLLPTVWDSLQWQDGEVKGCWRARKQICKNTGEKQMTVTVIFPKPTIVSDWFGLLILQSYQGGAVFWTNPTEITDTPPPHKKKKIYLHFTVHRFLERSFFSFYYRTGSQTAGQCDLPPPCFILLYLGLEVRPFDLQAPAPYCNQTKYFFFSSGHRTCFQRAFLSHCDQEKRGCRHRTLMHFCHLSQTFSNFGQFSLLCRCCFILLWQRELF